MEMIRVMIVDDEQLALEGIKHLLSKLERYGFTVTEVATNGREALEKCLGGLADIVLTDIKMPIMDGIQLIGELKRLTPEIPVIILSCHDDFGYAQEAIRHGVVDYVLKYSVNSNELLAALNKAVERKTKILSAIRDLEGVDSQTKKNETGGETKKITRKEIEQICEYVHKNYMEDLSLTRIAEYINMSPNYLSKLFYEETGENLITYINRTRIHKAKEIMEKDCYLVYEIAEMVGIPDSKYFSKVFKGVMGVPPKDYNMYPEKTKTKKPDRRTF